MRKSRHSGCGRQAGFTLVELGVSLVLMGVLALAFVAYWRMSAQEKATVADRDLLAVTERAVVGFAHARFRLPCPARDQAGDEDCTGGRQVGFLPWRTLGVADARAGTLMYGAYRAPRADQPWLDMDLAQALDRLRPAFTVGLPPVLPATPLALNPPNANLLDFCYALTLASNAPADGSALGVVDANADASRRAVAFTVAAAGLLDADGDGNPFDGRQASASSAFPTFDAANRPLSGGYDDRVLAVPFNALFAQMQCGQALSAVSHSHVNAATAAASLQQALVDYKRQLEIAALLAGAGVASATAGVLSASAGLASAVAASANAVAFTILTYGSAAGVMAPAVAAVVSNTAAVAASAGTLALSVVAKQEADRRVTEVVPLVTDSATLATAIDADARTADNLGF
ncbi:type II secretion system protein [Xylophilus sp. Leaf220]|uniref:type II secretion system protein n=1 Tax=Xylophilus sp. Leaf220 TaxID=1735686 RepID=UPI000701BCBC|nr:type II secretion system protein [Xylophilus sp. Leaf220]KQM70121.1 hypothetical protein ASE76_09915 [Xylophilus sp. Leaf220]